MPKRLAKKKLKVKIKQKQKQKQTQIVNVNITGRPRRIPAKKSTVKVEQPIQQIFRVNEPNYPIYRFQEPIQQPAVTVPAVAVAQPNRFEASNQQSVPVVVNQDEQQILEQENFVELQFRQNPNDEDEKQVLNPDSKQWVKLKGITGKKVMKKYRY